MENAKGGGGLQGKGGSCGGICGTLVVCTATVAPRGHELWAGIEEEEAESCGLGEL